MVVAALENRLAEGVVIWDTDATLVSEDPGLHLPIGKPGAEREGNILVHVLQGLEH
jgi:hypothetical protein